MKIYKVTGMTCTACSSKVEKVVSDVSGVTKCQVNLLQNSMIVEGDFNEEDVIFQVKKAGYGIITDTIIKDEKNPLSKMIKSLVLSGVLLILLMYISMGKMMFDFPLPEFLNDNLLSNAILQMLIASFILIINNRFFKSGFKSLLNKSPNMDTLISLGSIISFVYSVFNVFVMSDNLYKGYEHLNKSVFHNLYFESSAMILVFISIGKLLESYSKGKTTSAVNSLIDMSPKVCTILRDSKEYVIDVKDIKKGDIFLVRPGESIATDGVCIDGVSNVDESSLTGESVPVFKDKGSIVYSATININGTLKCEATSPFSESSFSKIINMVNEASSSKAPIAKVADKVSSVFVPLVMTLSLLTFIIWFFIGKDVAFSIERAVSVLVISCPCALGLATPVAIMVASGVGAKKGILYKNAEVLENTGKIKTIAFDKTGTITKGECVVTDVLPYLNKDELLKCAYSLESLSEHPLSFAVCNYSKENNINKEEVTDFIAVIGEGVSGKINGENCYGGKYDYIKKYVNITDEFLKMVDNTSNGVKTPLYFAKGDEFLGVIMVADTIKDDAPQSIKLIKKLGFKTILLTGDNEKCASFVAHECKFDDYKASLTPDKKDEYIKEIQKDTPCIMVGDGINDSPSLTRAQVGISIGNAKDVAIESSDIVITKKDVVSVYDAISLSKKALRTIKQNLFWAFIYNVIGIPFAIGIFGLKITPWFASACMSLSSIFVVTNALRIKLFKSRHEKQNKKEKLNMETIIKVDGMMCMHCEKRVKDLLEKVDGVENCVCNHKEKTAILTLSKEVDLNYIKTLIENEGYKVI